jgi:hypothetical protein
MNLTREKNWQRIILALGLVIVVGVMATGVLAAVSPSMASEQSAPDSETEEVIEHLYIKRQRLNLATPERGSKRAESSSMDWISELLAGTPIRAIANIRSGRSSGVWLILSTGSPGQMIFRSPPFPA